MSKMPPLPEPYLSAEVTSSLLGPNVREPLFLAVQVSACALEYAGKLHADLLARLSAAEADAQRYRYYIESSPSKDMSFLGEVYSSKAELDAAIDAARSKA